MTTSGAGTADSIHELTPTPTTTTTTTTTLPPADVDCLQASIQAFSESQPDDQDRKPPDSAYWDPASMTPLNARSAAAVARLRAFRPPPFPLWDRLPTSRRAAVLVLLYADRRGDLRVVLTMRAASLRNYSGHAAFPGGKADTRDETAVQIARREAWEEIGLPLDDDDAQLPPPYRIEHLCDLPHNLARTELVVRPCVALLHADGAGGAAGGAADALIPRLDAKEVAAVFSAPFHNFLLSADEMPADNASGKPPPGTWYEGSWTKWHDTPWRMHFFYVPVAGQRVAKPRPVAAAEAKPAETAAAAAGDELEDVPGRYKVWGMTARIMVDAAQLAYGEAPAFEHNPHFGDEAIIEGLEKAGRLGEKPGSQSISKSAEPAHKDKDASKM